jgi:hypothetical protein
VTVAGILADQPGCPVCGADGRPLLDLPEQPIYQHPVPADAVVPAPHAIDLRWLACTHCCHAWQPEFDHALLERIYRSHYYTPAPDGIGVRFRNDFLSAVERFGLVAPRRVLLEIGASDGDVLLELRMRTGAVRAYAFEPNSENAAVARRRGLDVQEEFFDGGVASKDLEPTDLICARHVIEHIFDFNGFFAGLNAVAVPTADLILETPSLDHHAERGSIVPFHIEHIHVFALRSLARLASGHGWGLQQAEVTASGNLIASFTRGRVTAEVPSPSLEGLQSAVAQRRIHLQNVLAGRRLVFWGAGSAGVGLVNTIGREPDIWTDGNPNKIGKKFVGLKRRIVSPELAFAEARSPAFSNPILVVASSFVDEILPRVRHLGWGGEIIDSAGNRL